MSIHFSDEEELNLDSKSKQICDCGFSLCICKWKLLKTWIRLI